MSEQEFYSDNIDYRFLGEETNRLFVSHHQPKDPPNNITVILLNPIFEERSRGHRYLFNWSRLLAGRGYRVVRFDYYGQGDSDGKVQELSVESCLADLSRIFQWATSSFPGTKIALHGLRWGGSIAAIWAVDTKVEIDHLLLWEPIENGKDYIMGELRMNLTTQLIVHKKVIEDRKALTKRLEAGEPVNIDGYHLSPKLWEQIERINLTDINYHCRTMLYKFMKPPKKAAEGEPVKYPIIESVGRLAKYGSIIPTFYLEIPDYTNKNSELFRDSIHWMEQN